jgi:hypothetical protein
MVLSESAFTGKIILQLVRTFFDWVSYSVSNDEMDVTTHPGLGGYLAINP